MIHIVNLSGGADSTALTLKLLELGYPIDYIVFADTGKDFPQMLEHIEKLKTYIKQNYPSAPPITTLKKDKSFDYLMFEHVKTRGKRKGCKGYGWATMRNRWCTSQLKTQEIDKFCRNLKDDVTHYIGIAADEPNRLIYKVQHCKKRNQTIYKSYPLADLGITEAEALQYCYDKGFNWGGLYKHFKRVSCWCCPLKNLKELKMLYQFYPELWQELKEMESKSFNRFRLDYTFEQLESKFDKEIKKSGDGGGNKQ